MSFLLHGAYMLVSTTKNKSQTRKVKGSGENGVRKSDHKAAADYHSDNWTEKKRVSPRKYLIPLGKEYAWVKRESKTERLDDEQKIELNMTI